MIRAAKEIKDYTNVSRTVFFQGDCLYENLATPKILNTAVTLDHLYVLDILDANQITYMNNPGLLLKIAASNGSKAVFSYLLNNFQKNINDKLIENLIDIACQNSRFEILDCLINFFREKRDTNIGLDIIKSSLKYPNCESIFHFLHNSCPIVFRKMPEIVELILSSKSNYTLFLQKKIWNKYNIPISITSHVNLRQLCLKRLEDFATLNIASQFLEILSRLDNIFIPKYTLKIIKLAHNKQDFSIIKTLREAGVLLNKYPQEFRNILPSAYKSELMDLGLINEIFHDEKYIASMFEEVNQASELYHPSKFWDFFTEINMIQLRESGIQSFKQTVNQVYYNYVPINFRDPLVLSINLLKLLGKIPVVNKYRLKDPDMEGQLSWKKSYRRVFQGKHQYQMKLYKRTIGLLCDYARSNDPELLMDRLSESEFGNPIDLRLNGKLLSQDLANSVLEYYSMVNPIGYDRYKKLFIAEIGAGYGRLASVFLQARNCKYVIFDIAPTLYVAQSYLTVLFKNKKIFKFRRFTNFKKVQKEFEEADIAFFTINQIEFFPENYFNLSINISSFHEMRYDQISCILNEMCRVTKNNIYIKQYKKYINPHDKLCVRREHYVFSPEWSNTMYRTVPTNRRFFEALYEKKV
ncbi:MAG: hypothetical protein A2X70_05900 [Alphaproteobacteria bacterium GWC2_42_16]|nr:MAG: hypothetical protein A2X70_05900 [Alphaproteobacteria bacterium GWC2_42_16]OFW73663.1 MAG: hypothetical protein A2Z80_02230 [Alphaproteobacteria bacterium GWA2_41_27]OFW81957.1 MAG: hypothetical protein A3E50_02065 [Alphaproteobacteria bacterium RIFCSPHIGHO2_12_FULL_42_100]OFW85989.1 MAG: hypothetical protein A2W06_00070 [Alphaproteobacteria bacterium RBG_16_42_14]OFW91093.1 MAG: hypothetical protein A3C41_05260 [Alphaproteobacteria bacterium RIFCSPHIGHO2_02_FULL_42_30]OFW93581.1 MAG: 